jgi:predicted component of type VI protein secretion system
MVENSEKMAIMQEQLETLSKELEKRKNFDALLNKLLETPEVKMKLKTPGG